MAKITIAKIIDNISYDCCLIIKSLNKKKKKKAKLKQLKDSINCAKYFTKTLKIFGSSKKISFKLVEF